MSRQSWQPSSLGLMSATVSRCEQASGTAAPIVVEPTLPSVLGIGWLLLGTGHDHGAMTIHLSREELEAGVGAVRESPGDNGTVELIVSRPGIDQREVLEVAELDVKVGLVGDTWPTRGSSSTEDGSAHPEKQLTLTNSRFMALVSPDPDRRSLAGDQLHVDLDLSGANLPPGTRLAIGTAVIEITEPPHNGCAKYSARFGIDAVRFANSPVGKELHLRGVNAKVVQGGTIHRGDVIRKV
jgi:hypothetical protein